MVVAVLFDYFGHSVRGGGVRTADGDEGIDGFTGDGGDEGEEGWVGGGRWVLGCGWEEVFSADRGDVGDYLDIVGQV